MTKDQLFVFKSHKNCEDRKKHTLSEILLKFVLCYFKYLDVI